MDRGNTLPPDHLVYVGADFDCVEATTGARGPTGETAIRSETRVRAARRRDAE
jgi:hypothetical protein